MKATLVTGLVMFGLGVASANAFSSPEVDIVRLPPKTIVVEKQLPGETEYVFPPACGAALVATKTIVESSHNMYDAGTKQLEIISDARKAMFGGDLAAVENAQRRLQGRTVADLEAITEEYEVYDQALAECEQEKP